MREAMRACSIAARVRGRRGIVRARRPRCRRGNWAESGEVPPVVAHVSFPAGLARSPDPGPAHRRRAWRGGKAAHSPVCRPCRPNSASEICRRTLMQILPAAAERDFAAFGQGRLSGSADCRRSFCSRSRRRPIRQRRGRQLSRSDSLRYGASGIGQSSWGPTGFAFARDPDQAEFLARAPSALVRAGRGNHNLQGPRSWRGDPRGSGPFNSIAAPGGNMAKNILHMVTSLTHMSPLRCQHGDRRGL